MINIISGAVSLGLLWAIMALGVYITYRILDYADLTVEGSIVTGAAIAAKLISMEINPFVATLVAFAGGMAAGVVTGLLNTKLRIPGILSGILSMIGLYSINIKIMGKPNITLLKAETVFTVLSKSKATVLIVGGAMAVILVVALYMFLSTSLGNAVRATGNNEKMARAMGINTDTMKILGLSISNGLVALSGALIAQSQGYSDMNMGQGAIVIGLASVIIGEVLYHKNGMLNKLSSVLVGAVAYRVIIAWVIDWGMDPLNLKLFTAITVAVALSMPRIKKYAMNKINAVEKKVSDSKKIKIMEKEETTI